MKKLGLILLTLVFPTALNAAEIKGTILKVNNVESQIVLKTDRGEETFLTTKTTKGMEHAKEGAKVIVTFSEKDGQPKISEIVPDD